MPTTPYKALPLPTQGVTTTWGDALNNFPFALLDSMLGGITTKTLSASNVILTVAESQTLAVRFTGAITANIVVTTVCQGFTLIENLTSGSFTVSVTNSVTYGGTAVGTPVVIPQGGGYVVLSDAVNGSRLVLPATASGAATVGRIADFPGTTVPYGWLKGNGALVSRASYPALWAYANASGNIQTDADWIANKTYGCFSTGDTTTTFRLPDLRGYFRRSWADDNTASPDYGRAAGSFQDAIVLNHIHPVTVTDNHYHFSFSDVSRTFGGGSLLSSNYPYREVAITNFLTNYSIWGSSTVPTVGRTSTSQNPPTAVTTSNTGGSATENRPQNIAVMTCISYL